ncbi:MAG TPA: arylesterase [Gammaproteobacteria bacterium]|jgi:acyl-CoA thioesterase-1|nr:arylesterase [Gammaproteobacteria bacterium]
MFRRLTALVLAAALCLPAAFGAGRTIVVVGDSLSSGYGIAAEQSWVALLKERLGKEGYGYDVVNASIAGDTSAGGLSRLPRLLAAHSPSLIVIELGGNDGLRGQPIDALRDNLAKMIEQSQRAGARVALAAVQIPPNYGPAYTSAMAAVYPDLAQRFGATLVDLALADVALKPELMQSDGIHPNAAGQKIVFASIWRALGPLLAKRDDR